MIEFERARQQLMAQATQLASMQQVALVDALGMVLAEDVLSTIDVPPTDNSAVDGYAFALASREQAQDGLVVSQRVAAGQVADALAQGSAARIFTGAAVPHGADLVVMQEDVRVEGEHVFVSADVVLTAGKNIRRRGQDVQAGETIVSCGEKLTPWHLGLLASVGIARVTVFKPLRIGVLSTGDELQEPGEVAQAGKIFNSNRYLMLTLIRACGFEPIDGGKVADTAAATEAALARMAEQVDVVVTSGGVSVGEEDHVRAAVEALGSIALWKIAIKPGKPFAFGNLGEALFAGLPGNPSAVLVTFLVLLKPFLDRCQGRVSRDPVPRLLRCAFSMKPGRRQEYLRVQLSDDITGKGNGACLILHPNQSSGMLSSACWADGLAVLAPGKEIRVGDALPFLSFEELLR